MAVLTHEFWQSHFNADPNILGQTLIADGLPNEIIGAVNLTSLLLVRISGRTRELALRQALGARSSHLAREVWCETTLLALGGGLLGLAMGAVARALNDAPR